MEHKKEETLGNVIKRLEHEYRVNKKPIARLINMLRAEYGFIELRPTDTKNAYDANRWIVMLQVDQLIEDGPKSIIVFDAMEDQFYINNSYVLPVYELYEV